MVPYDRQVAGPGLLDMIGPRRISLTRASEGKFAETSMKESVWRRPLASGVIPQSSHAREWQCILQRRRQDGEPNGSRRSLRDPGVRVVLDLGRRLHLGDHPVGAARTPPR